MGPRRAIALTIGEQGRLPTQVTHHKMMGKAAWVKSVDTLRLIDEARARGVDVTIDQYPYTASNTSIQAGLFPAWAQEGGRVAILARLKDEPSRRRILTAVSDAIENERAAAIPPTSCSRSARSIRAWLAGVWPKCCAIVVALWRSLRPPISFLR